MVKRIIRRMIGLFVRGTVPKLKPRKEQYTCVHSKPSINMVTSWKTRCGIASYSANLAKPLAKNVKLYLVPVSTSHVYSPRYLISGLKTGRSQNVVHVQLEYSMFGDLRILHKRLGSFTSMLFYMGLALGNRPVITTFHEVRSKIRANGSVGLAYAKALNKLIFTVSNIVIVHTLESKELLAKTYHVAPSKIKIMPMGSIDNPVLLDQEDCKNKLGLSGKKVLTIPGFVSHRKGHDKVLKVLSSLGNDVHLVIAGGTRATEDEAYYAELKKYVAENHLADKVTFNDDFPLSKTVINASDLAILPYRSATDSLMLRDLAAYRVPILASDLILFQSVKNEYDCLELFEKDNPQDLQNKIRALLVDGSRQKHLKEHCIKMWKATRWSAVAAKHAELYLEVLSGHPDEIYDDPRQKERINWLKDNTSGSGLEIGCAGGFITNYVGADVGLDINPCRIRFAKAKHPDKDFITASAFSMPFKDHAFSTLLIPEILEHVPYTAAQTILVEAKRVGCKVLITVPNANKPNYDPSIVENPEHMWFPTEELMMKLTGNGNITYSSKNDFILVQWTCT